jgi:hypothetical protein
MIAKFSSKAKDDEDEIMEDANELEAQAGI